MTSLANIQSNSSGKHAEGKPQKAGLLVGKSDELLLMLMVVALSVQGPSLFALGSMDFTFGHALVGIVGAVSAVRCLYVSKRIVIPPISLHILFGTFVVLTCLNSSPFGFGTMIFKYVFQYLVLVVALNLMALISDGNRSSQLITWGAWIVLVIVLINAAMNYSVFLEYYDHPWDGHPNYPTIFSGGVNLEATWPAMLGVFFRDNKEGHIYLTITYVFAALVQSRAGVVLAVLAAAYVIVVRHDETARLLVRILVVIAAGFIAVLFVLVGPRAISAQASAEAAREAASAAEEDPDSLLAKDSLEGSSEESSQPKGVPGRSGIWTASLELLEDMPLLGFGSGHAMDAVRSLTQYPYREDNVHNYPLQIMLDFGFIGFAVFAVITAAFLVKAIRARMRSPFAAFVVLYLIGGMIQFAGAELLVGFALAGYFAFGADMQGGSAWVFGKGRIYQLNHQQADKTLVAEERHMTEGSLDD